jgi:hypothetical protein
MKSDDDDEKPAKKKPSKTDDDDEKVAKKDDDDDNKKPKKVASKDGDGEITGAVELPGKKMDPELAVSPGQRALDGVAGVSFNARRLAFTADSDLGPSNNGTGRPPSYRVCPSRASCST